MATLERHRIAAALRALERDGIVSGHRRHVAAAAPIIKPRGRAGGLSFPASPCERNRASLMAEEA